MAKDSTDGLFRFLAAGTWGREGRQSPAGIVDLVLLDQEADEVDSDHADLDALVIVGGRVNVVSDPVGDVGLAALAVSPGPLARRNRGR